MCLAVMLCTFVDFLITVPLLFIFYTRFVSRPVVTVQSFYLAFFSMPTLPARLADVLNGFPLAEGRLYFLLAWLFFYSFFLRLLASQSEHLRCTVNIIPDGFILVYFDSYNRLVRCRT